jgi:hypothetical protein
MMIFGFSKPAKWKIGAEIIKLIEHTEFSHCYVMWKSEGLRRFLVYQASGHGGVDFMSIERFLEHNIIMKEYHYDINPTEKTALMQFCIDNAGDDYGYLQLVGIAYHRLMDFIFEDTPNPFPHGQVCSEVVARILTDVLHVPIEHLDPNVAGPYDVDIVLNRLCTQHPDRWVRGYGTTD